MSRTRYKPQIKQSTCFTLNITSMTDMFTILLVFLLQSFASDNAQIQAVEGLRLPSSNSDKNPVSGVQLSLTKSALKVNDSLVATLTLEEFNAQSLDANDSSFIKPLFEKLLQLEADMKLKNKINTGQILLLADQDMSYGLIRKVMYTASMAGFPNLKLVTTVGE